jgi:hypothetical protein
MADDLIPAVQTGEGAAPRAGYNPGPDYRSVQAPVQVRTDLPSSGGAARAAQLSQTFKEFESAAGTYYDAAAAQAGKLAGQASGATGNPQYKTGIARFTAYNEAFNNAATGAYAMEVEAQIDDDATRLRIAANKNPDTFVATFSAVRDAALKEAPPYAVPMLQQKYNEKLAEGRAAIVGDQFTEQRELQAKVWAEGTQRQTSRVAELTGSLDPAERVLAPVEQAKLNSQIEGGFNSGLYSRAAADAMHVESQRTIVKQVVETQFDRELATGDAAAYIENFRQQHLANTMNPNEPQVLSEPEYDQLMQNMKTQLSIKRSSLWYGKQEANAADDEKLKAGDKVYTAKLADGTLTARDIGPAILNHDLSPEVGRALLGYIERGPEPKSDPKALQAAYFNPHVLDWTSHEVALLSDVSSGDKIKLMSWIDQKNNSWEGTTEVRQGSQAIAAALKIQPGTNKMLLPDDAADRYAQAQNEYIQALAKLPPAERRAAAVSTAQLMITHANQRSFAQQADGKVRERDAWAAYYGPGGKEQWAKPAFDARMKDYNDQIDMLRKQAKGQ